MATILLISLLLVLLMLCAMVVFIFFWMKRIRAKRHIPGVLDELLIPHGFTCRFLGTGGKWTGQYGNCEMVIYDIATIPGRTMGSGGAFGSYRAPAAGMFRIHLPHSLGVGSRAGQIPFQVGHENAQTLFRDQDLTSRLQRLIQPPVVVPIAVTPNDIQARLIPDSIEVESLRGVLDDLASFSTALKQRDIIR